MTLSEISKSKYNQIRNHAEGIEKTEDSTQQLTL